MKPNPQDASYPIEVEIPIYTRTSPRYATSIMARVAGEAAMQESRGNVSAGGFCFEWDETLPVGTRIELLFRLPGAGYWLKGLGEVLGSREADNDGILVRGRFLSLDAGDAELLQRWIESFASLDEAPEAPPEMDDPNELLLYSTTIEA